MTGTSDTTAAGRAVNGEALPEDEARPLGASSRNAWRVTPRGVRLDRVPRPPRLVTVAASPADLVLDLSRTAAIVIDMQNDFCHRDGWLASIGVDVQAARRPIASLVEGLPALRAAGAAVVWLNWGTRPDHANLPPNVLHVYDPDARGMGIGSVEPTGHPVLERGSWGAAVVDELVAAPEDLWVHKHRMSGFWDTDLDSVLRNLDVTTLLFAGVNADQCVLATLIDGACIGYDVVMCEDASATTNGAVAAAATAASAV